MFMGCDKSIRCKGYVISGECGRRATELFAVSINTQRFGPGEVSGATECNLGVAEFNFTRVRDGDVVSSNALAIDLGAVAGAEVA